MSILVNGYPANHTCTSKVRLAVPWSFLATPPHLLKTPVVEVVVPPPMVVVVHPYLALHLAGLSSLTRMRTRTTLTSRRFNPCVLSC